MTRAALVTGGAVRVGRAIAIGLAEAGYDVIVTYHRSDAAAREVQRAIEALGRRALLVRADLASPDDVAAVARETAERYQGLDLLVNSAASFRAANVLDVDADAWDAVMDLNLRGPFLLIRETASLLRAARGSVVNIVDLSAIQPWVGHPHHAVSKAGLLHLTRVMARALAPHVRVNAIAPGAVLPPEGTTDEELERLRGSAPLGTLGSPEDVLRTVLFLASSPFITGDVVLVDGGRHLV